MADDDKTTPEEEADKPDPKDEDKPSEPEKKETPKADEPDWKAESRKHERRAKQTAKKLEEYEAKLSKIEEANKSEAEKAIDKARKEAIEEARSEANKELRAERLNSAIAREAAKDFADVDDAIALLDKEDDELFNDEGAVQTDALKAALSKLLERKPHLKADAGRPTGSSDAGKGDSGGVSPEEMTVEDHLKAQQAQHA